MVRPREETDLELSTLITAHLRGIRASVAKLAKQGEESPIHRDMLLAVELLQKSAAVLKRRAGE